MYIPDFGYKTAAPLHTVAYLSQPIEALLPPIRPGTRVLDIGCGNGFWAKRMIERGCEVVGIDPSEEGVAQARRLRGARFEATQADEHLLERLGEKPFDLVISIEVIEHVYLPREWARACFASLRPGGTLICTTPYHGFLKNVLLSLSNKWDTHIDPLWDGGHIKFWSRATLGRLLCETGFREIRFQGAGRLPYLWMSMVFRATKPQ